MNNEKFHYKGDFALAATLVDYCGGFVQTVEGRVSRFTIERDSGGNAVRIEAEFVQRTEPFTR